MRRWLLALPLILACQASAPPDAGARPDLNADFRKPDLDVAAWVERLEGESREIVPRTRELVAALALRPGDAVADIGAGTGLFEAALAERVGPAGSVFAVDISPAFLAHIDERAAAAGLTQVRTVLCDDRSTGLPPGSVDAAFICDTYHHFEHPAQTLASLRTALRPGGRLVIVDFERVEGVSRQWILDHVRCGSDETRAEVEAAGFRFERKVPVPGLQENYVLLFVAPGEPAARSAAPPPGAVAAIPHDISMGELTALAASPEAAVRLAALRHCVTTTRELLAHDPIEQLEIEPSAEADPRRDERLRARQLRSWAICFPAAIQAAEPTLSSQAWAAVDVDIANDFSDYLALLADGPDFAFDADDEDGNQFEQLRLLQWLEAHLSDPHFRAYLIFTFDDGPFFPAVVEGGAPLAAHGSVPLRDGLAIQHGDALRIDDSDELTPFLQGTRDGEVMWTAFLDESQAGAEFLELEEQDGRGWWLRLSFGERVSVHLDQDGRPEFYFVSW